MHVMLLKAICFKQFHQQIKIQRKNRNSVRSSFSECLTTEAHMKEMKENNEIKVQTPRQKLGKNNNLMLKKAKKRYKNIIQQKLEVNR